MSFFAGENTERQSSYLVTPFVMNIFVHWAWFEEFDYWKGLDAVPSLRGFREFITEQLWMRFFFVGTQLPFLVQLLCSQIPWVTSKRFFLSVSIVKVASFVFVVFLGYRFSVPSLPHDQNPPVFHLGLSFWICTNTPILKQ